MHELNVSLVTIGGLVMVFGAVSTMARRVSVPGPLVALLSGVVIGPSGFGLIDPASWGRQEVIMEQAARLTLAIGLMAVALRLPKGDPIRRWRSLAALLGLLMPMMWLISGLLVYFLLGLPFWASLLVGAVVTPTDPVVASSIVTGEVAERNLPASIRHTISGESGFNDGLAYPFALLPILMLTLPTRDAVTDWLTRTLLWEVVGASIFGALLGYAAGWFLRWAESKGLVEQTSFLAFTIALSLVALGGGKLLGTDGILAVFLAGIAMDLVVSSDDRVEEERVQEAVNRFFTLPVFVLLGAMLPWAEWRELGWPGVMLVATVLLLRRLPAILALRPLLAQVKDMPNVLFMGWFGPVGVAAIFYANLAQRRAGVEEAWIVGSLLICSSLIVHGLTSSPLTRLYGQRTGHGQPTG